MLKMRTRFLGFTFTEMMAALAINALIFSALITIVMANIDHYRRGVNAARLDQQLQTAMMIMTEDIRRAGFWASANSDVGTGANNNPFMASGADVTISGSCILISYDKDKNNLLPAISASIDDERYGFRLNNQVLQARPPGAAFNCSASASAWENLTDPSVVTVTNLSFTLSQSTITTGPGTKGIRMRSIDISLSGQLTGDSSVTRTITQHVRIRNDKIIP